MMGVSRRRGNVAVTAVVKVDALDETQLGEQVERAIDGDETEVRVFFARALVNFGGREMMVGRRDDFEDRLARSRQFAAVLAQAVAHSERNRGSHRY